jgi:hypothetical protein
MTRTAWPGLSYPPPGDAEVVKPDDTVTLTSRSLWLLRRG